MNEAPNTKQNKHNNDKLPRKYGTHDKTEFRRDQNKTAVAYKLRYGPRKATGSELLLKKNKCLVSSKHSTLPRSYNK